MEGASEVLGGLAEGQQVVTTEHFGLSDNEYVNVNILRAGISLESA